MDRSLTNTVQRLTITGYTGDGAGVARLSDGMVVFAVGAVAGETCSVRITKVGRTAAYGVVTEVERPSPQRRESDCPYYGRCGGCVWRHLSYEEECRAKRQQVDDALRRIGGLDLKVSQMLGARDPDRYRNKAQFPVGGGAEIGFYRSRSHQVVNVGDCLLQKKAAMRLRGAVRGWMKANSVAAYDEHTGRGLLRHVYVRTNRAGESLCCLLVNGPALPEEEALVEALRAAEPALRGVVLGVNRRRDNVILGEEYRTIWGEDTLTDTLCGLEFRLSVPAFYQVNPDQTEALYAKAVEFAVLTGKETVLDLYCGVGTIGLCMARSAGKVYGAEVVPQAVDNARENALRNGIANAEFFCADAGEAAGMLASRGVRPDVVCVDPPRKGLAPDVIETVAAMAPRTVVYVSCDPATLARDLARFAQQGYRAEKAVAVDLFPRTAHVETVVMLSK